MPSNIDKPDNYIKLSKDEFDIELLGINNVKFLSNKRREFLSHMKFSSKVIKMDFSDEIVEESVWILQPDYLYLIDERIRKLALYNDIEDVSCAILDRSRGGFGDVTNTSLLEIEREVCNDRLEISLGGVSQSVNISFAREVNDGQKIYPIRLPLTFYIEDGIKELQKEMRGSKESDIPSLPSVRSSSAIVSL